MNQFAQMARHRHAVDRAGRAPAQAADPRRPLLAKVHIAAKELNLAGDAYIDVLFGVTGKDSAGACSIDELKAVLDRMKALGWLPAQPKGRVGRRAKPADHKSATKARALWISLYHLGAVHNPGEIALEAFAKRQLKCDALQWANQSQMFRLIEALKAIGDRHGWDQSTEGLTVAAVPLVLRRRLVERIFAKLIEAGLVPADWTLEQAGFRLAGIEFALLTASASVLDQLARALGDKLRATAGKKA